MPRRLTIARTLYEGFLSRSTETSSTRETLGNVSRSPLCSLIGDPSFLTAPHLRFTFFNSKHDLGWMFSRVGLAEPKGGIGAPAHQLYFGHHALVVNERALEKGAAPLPQRGVLGRPRSPASHLERIPLFL